MEIKQQIMENFFVLGHRGAVKLAFENTLESFKQAAKYVPGVELDVHLSKDGVPVVVHDDTVMLDGKTKEQVGLMTLDELSKVELGEDKANIPSLEQVIAIMPKNSIINIELKGFGNFSPEFLSEQIKKLLKSDIHNYIISSFDPKMLQCFEPNKTKYLTALLVGRQEYDLLLGMTGLFSTSTSFDALHLEDSVVQKLIVAWAHCHRQLVVVWTVNNIERALELFDMGVDGIITDDVELFKSV